MIRSLSTGVSGLKSHQIRMDVIGNNIANVNTVAFKRGRAAFSETLGQQLLSIAPTGSQGINPSFVGLGVNVSTINQSWGQGSLQNTNGATDLAINGDGFFIVRSGDRQMLTRAGNYAFDEDGFLVTSTGLNVQGFAFQENGELDMTEVQDISIDLGAQSPPKFTETATVTGNLSADAEAGTTETMSIKIYDEQGTAHNLIIDFTKTANADEWDYEIRYGGDLTPPPFATVNGSMTFNTDGTVSNSSETVTWDTNFVTGGGTFDINFESLTQYSAPSTAAIRDQDGYDSGRLVGFFINPEGILSLNFSNGQQESLYQLAVGNVNNPNGLEQLGDNLYGLTTRTGDLQIGRAGFEVRSAIVAGALEMSNVELVAEFAEMIKTQRGFQASARIITTSDEMLQETVSLKR